MLVKNLITQLLEQILKKNNEKQKNYSRKTKKFQKWCFLINYQLLFNATYYTKNLKWCYLKI